VTSPRDSTMILPQLVVSMTAISGSRSRKIAAILCMMRDRSSGVMRGHGPSSNAWRAAATARSTSSTPALAMRPTGSLVVGVTVSNVSPVAAGTFSPPMSRS
jgi:hypothetical protein